MNPIIEFAYGTSDRLKTAVLSVLARLPADDRDMLRRRKIQVREESSRNANGMDDGYGLVEPVFDEWSIFKCTVSIDLAIVPLDGALLGLIAHELAHARLNHHQDVARWRSMGLDHNRAVTLANNAERQANSQAAAWGFTSEMEELREFMAARRQAKMMALASKTLN